MTEREWGPPRSSWIPPAERDSCSDPRLSLSPLRPPFEHEPVPIEIGLWWSGIEDIDALDLDALGDPARPADALAVGHTLGTTSLTGPERALDVAMSRAARGVPGDARIPGAERILTALARRGVLPGLLASLSFLPDPRAPGRVVAIAGVGLPGRLGQAELCVLAAELCWALGQMGKRHLVTPLIGASGLKTSAALQSWIRGLRAAVCPLAHDERRRLARITLVSNVAAEVLALDDALRRTIAVESARPPHKPRLAITYAEGPVRAFRGKLDAAPRARPPAPIVSTRGEPTPTRVAVEWNGKRFRIGVMTETAVVPQRDLRLDPALVDDANQRLAASTDASEMLHWGRYVGGLLLREELRLSGDAPLVLMLDPASARIYWELLADQGLSYDTSGFTAAPLGISPGVCRQLRTTSAPRPEPPPPPRRLLRVLVVADPADDLPAARAEGEAIAWLFASFNEAWAQADCKVEVTSLLGAGQATRNDVLYRLTSRGPYDVLHYAGHSVHDEQDPDSSGWIFERGSRLSIHELNRVDRIPRFVFSNACRSGVIQDAGAPAAPSLALAPTFAAAFFGRGVADFVCTAWSVEDGPACAFAMELYASLLGLVLERTPEGTYTCHADRENGPQPMYRATREARRKLAEEIGDVRTWGAYQHYGDPYLRLFDPETLLQGAPSLPDDTEDDAHGGGMLPPAPG